MRRVLALALLGVTAACGAEASAPVEAATRTGGFDALAEAYRRGHVDKDVEALAALVHSPETAFSQPDVFRASVRDELRYAIRSIELKPLAPDETLTYTRNGVTWRPTMPPVGRMLITYDVPPPGDGGGISGLASSYLVGIDRGLYRIVLAEPMRSGG